MAAPTFVASYTTVYDTDASPKTLSVTTQAGDMVVVYGAIENGAQVLDVPSGNNIPFTVQQTVAISNMWGAAYIWAGIDELGGTSWTLSNTISATAHWGMTCLVFRGSGGIGAAVATNVSGAAPSLDITTLQGNSALVTVVSDWNGTDGSSRTWRTVNSVTPTLGNGLELNYTNDAPVLWVSYGAYYDNAGSAGLKTVGLSAPGGQKYSMVAVEVFGSPIPSLQTDSVTNISTTTATANGSVNSDGGDTITERGFVWSTSPNPTTSDSKVTAAGTTGSYNASLTGLSSGTLYHVRAYAINSSGTGYGIDVTFQNLGASINWVKG
ncbi:hypothetical protein EYC59_03770 [Candidatus Saccharibacteria bacterium]|nr:MAG: hypothetical protein EYC59_03770 [Candidatus Saccharibacteria bacterium]